MIIYLAMIDSPEGRHKFEFIYNRYKNLMFYTASKILGDTRDSEDTVHDAFLKIMVCFMCRLLSIFLVKADIAGF